MPTAPPVKIPITTVDGFSKGLKQATSKIHQVGTAASVVGGTLTRGLTLPIVGVGVASFKMSRDLNREMANVGALIPGQSGRLYKFRDDVRRISRDMAIDAPQVAQGLYDVISAFDAGVDTSARLNAVARMAKAGRASISESLGLLSATTKGYGDTSAAALSKVSDLSFLTVKLGQTTFPQLAGAIGRVVPLTAQLKVSQEELFGSFATLSGVTGNASEVSTQLAAIMTAFIKPSTGMTQAVHRLGFKSAEAMIKEKGLRDSLLALSGAAKGSTEKLGKMLGEKEAIVGMLALTGGQAENFALKLDAMKNAAGETDRAFKEQTDGIDKAGFKWDQTVMKLKDVAGALGDKLIPVVVRATDRFIPFLDRLSKVSDANFDLGIKIAGAAMVIGPFFSVIGTGLRTLDAMNKLIGVTGLAGGLKALSAPVGTFTDSLGKMDERAQRSAGRINALKGAIFGLTAGVAAGEAINQFILDPMNEKGSRASRRAEGVSIVGVHTADQRNKKLAELYSAQKNLAAVPITSEFVAGSIMSAFGGESPLTKLLSQQKDLTSMRLNLLSQGIAAGDQKMTIEFKNLPAGATVEAQRAPGLTPPKISVKNRGAVAPAGGDL
jgi:TP901 family phage tail tape measure protein